ncbi:MAG: AarF/UbiB family protein [Desulfovermiculus sp.]|nr:AarF/UbiB family protein [Desulfovermiculus sp.]
MHDNSPFSESSPTLLARFLDLGTLVPEQHAAYRPVIRDALLFFLQSLPLGRQWTIAREQMELPAHTSLIERVFALLHRCPSLHKLGQVLAHDRSLSPVLLGRLQALESMPALTPLSEIIRIIRQEVGSPQGLVLASRPLAEASVAVILPFTWTPSGQDAQIQGVFKVLKPGITEILHQELSIWSDLGEFLEDRCRQYGLPKLQYRESLQQIQRLLLQETRLDLEQANLSRAAALYAECPDIWIPKVLPLCTPRVTAMEYIPGEKVTDVNDMDENQRRRMAESMVSNLMARPLWSKDEEAFFHADPHAGNLLRTLDGRLAILDWSLLTTLSRQERTHLMQILLGALCLDAPAVCRALENLAFSPPDPQKLQFVVDRELQAVLSGSPPGFNWLLGLMDRAVTEAEVNFPESLAIYRKALHTLLGVVADVSETCSLDAVLMTSGLKEILAEWPQRAVSPYCSRDFGTHVSNLDLAGLMLSFPLLPLKAWNTWWQNVLKRP